MTRPFPHLNTSQIEALRTRIAQLFGNQTPAKPQVVDFQGQRFVVKFQRLEKDRRRRERLSALAYFLLFRQWLAPKRFKALGIYEEAERINDLDQAGVPVAPIYYFDQRFFIQAFSGTSLDTVLPRRPATERLVLIRQVIKNLAHLHQQGQWHGGPQIRNLTLHDNQLYRIDFEERFGFSAPLALAQAYDLLLSFNSIKKFLDNDLELGKSLFMQYWMENPDPALIPYLEKILRWLRPFLWIENWPGRNSTKNNDLQSSLFFAQILRDLLPMLTTHANQPSN